MLSLFSLFCFPFSFSCRSFLLKNLDWPCFVFLLAFFPERQLVTFNPPPPRKSLIWGHVRISIRFVCCSSRCYCRSCGAFAFVFVGLIFSLFFLWLFFLCFFVFSLLFLFILADLSWFSHSGSCHFGSHVFLLTKSFLFFLFLSSYIS